jgi:PAS domain S-box-containing protein
MRMPRQYCPNDGNARVENVMSQAAQGTTPESVVVEQAPDAIIVTDHAGAIRIWNTRAAEMFGYSMHEAIAGGLDLIIPEHLRAAHWRGFREATAAGKVRSHGRSVVSRAVHKDGSKLYVELSFAILADDLGGTLGAIAIARDITERHRASVAGRERPGA